MSALLLASFLSVLCFLAGLMLPGYALRLRAAHWVRFSPAPGDVAVHAMALGLLWCTLQFFAVHGLALDLKGRPWLAASIKHGTDLALIALCSLRVRGFWPQYRQMLADLLRHLSKPDHLVGIVLAVSFATFAVFQFPYAPDNAALYWMSDAVMNPGASFLLAQGSPGYIAWLYWPAVLLAPTIPAATVASGGKLVLNLLAFFCCKRLCSLLPGNARYWAPWALYIMVLTTMMGDYGLLISAKETPFAVLFLFAGMARWISCLAHGRPEQAGVEAGALFGLAFGFGAISIPYLAVFLCLLLMLQPQAGAARQLLAIALWCGIPLSFSLATMLHKPQWLAAIATVGGTALLWMLAHPLDAMLGGWHRWVQGKQPYLGLGILIASIAACWLLLPVEFIPCARAPLDGKTDFTQVFFTGHWATRPYVSAAALVGMIVMLVHWRHEIWQPALAAILIFPFAALLPSLIVAHTPQIPLPFHPQHLWDLAKDIPNWCWGPIASFAALSGLILLVDSCSRKAVRSPRWQPKISAAIFTMLMATLGWHHFAQGRGFLMFRLGQGAHLNSIGGHRELDMSLYSEAISREITATLMNVPSSSPQVFPLFTQSNAPGGPPYLELNGSYASFVYLPPEETLSLAIILNHPAESGFLIASREWQQANVASNRPAMTLIELVPPVKGQSGDSLFFYRKTPAADYQLKLDESRLFRLPAPTLPQNLKLQPIASWEEFTSTKPRIKDGNLLIWGKQQGTVWLNIPRQEKTGHQLRLRVRFMGEKRDEASLTVSSPMFSAPIKLTQASRDLQTTVNVPKGDTPWVPVHFAYDGDLDTHPTLGYLKSYYLDELRLDDAVYLK